MHAVVYARTSGDEADTGQDCLAQARQVAAKLGPSFEVGKMCLDDGVSGSVPAMERPGFRDAVREAQERGGILVFREASRFARYHPGQALVDFERLPVRTVCQTEGHLTTLGQKEAEDSSMALLRFVTFWQGWSELQGLRRKTAAAMTEILEGRRATKSGKPPGRPQADLPPEDVRFARAAMDAGASFAEALRKLNERRVAGAVDPRVVKARRVGKGTLARALGLWASAQNVDAPKTQGDQEGAERARMGSLVGGSVPGSGGFVAGVQPASATPASGKQEETAGGKA